MNEPDFWDIHESETINVTFELNYCFENANYDDDFFYN